MIINWVQDNYTEILAAIAGLVYLYFSINQLIWLWPLGILGSVLYTIVFFHAGLYADMSLQIYYFTVSIYGWYHWKYGKKKDEEQLPVIRIGTSTYGILILVTILLTISSGYVLDHYFHSSIPYWDAFTTAGSIVATWMLARKMLENWVFWIVIDFVALGTYIYKELYATAALFLVYTVMAIIGYNIWKRDLKGQLQES